jgi:3-mercaptopyruvate sulfurtransferase SseA
VALRLRELGHENAFALEGGFDAWRRTGQHLEPKEAGGYPAPAP